MLAAPGSLRAGRLLRVMVRGLPGAPRWKHGSIVQVLAGTAAVAGRIFLPPESVTSEESEPEAFVLADLELEEPLALVPGERFVVRRPSPAANLGMGRFLAFADRRLRKRDAAERDALRRLAVALDDPAALCLRMLDQAGGATTAGELAARLGWTAEATRRALEEACHAGTARNTTGDRFVGTASAGALAREVAALLARFREGAPHRLRVPVSVLREGLGKQKSRTLEQLAAPDLEALGLCRRRGLEWDLLEVTPPPRVAALADRLHATLAAEAFRPAGPEAWASHLGVEEEELGRAAELLGDQGRAVRAADDLLFSREAAEELRAAVVEQFGGAGIDIPALRDRFDTSRKFLMPLLEYLDARGVTTRRGPNRILRDPEAALV